MTTDQHIQCILFDRIGDNSEMQKLKHLPGNLKIK